MIADLNMCVKPRLFVMDAIVGMEGNGPANGTPRDIRLLMVSDDPVALDSVCVTIMGLDYKSVIAVRTGEKSGLGVADTSKIDFSLIEGFGENQTVNRGKASEILPELVIKDFKNIIDGNSGMQRMSSMFGPFAKKIVLNRPTIIHENCTRCKVCIKACPVEPKAIYFDEESNKIRYTYGKCIRCFCCQELCPHAAIEVKKAPLGFILSGKRK
jgi:ferredoxin